VKPVRKLRFIMKNAQCVQNFKFKMVSVHVLHMNINQSKDIVLQLQKVALNLKMVNALNVILNTLCMMDNASFALKNSQDVQSANSIKTESHQLVLNVQKENT